MQKIKNILFITPYFNSGGSEYYLYLLLKELKHFPFKIALWSNQKGSYTNVQHHYPVYVNPFQKSANTFRIYLYSKKLFGIDWQFHFFKQKVKLFKPDLIYINTAVLPEYANYATKLNIPYVVHLHEMPSVFDSIPSNNFITMLDKAKHIICCSEAVKQSLNGFAFDKTSVLYEHIDINDAISKTNLHHVFNIDNDKFIWVMSGIKSYRKGYDLVPQICKVIEPYGGYLLWLGADREFGMNALIKHNLPNNFIETGLLDQATYKCYLASAHGFVLLSREDPFPLVMIEAASMGLPIVSFDSGGVKEFVQGQMGRVVPVGDVHSLVKEMLSIMQNPNLLENQQSHQRAQQFNVKISVKEWSNQINQLF